MINNGFAEPLIAIVAPFRDEAQCLPIFIESLRKNLESLTQDYEIILIDDGSVDNGWEILIENSTTDPRIKGIRFNRRFGKENAIRAGLAAVSAQTTIVMDADMQHPPDLIPEMFRIWNTEKVKVVDAVKKRSSGRNFFFKVSSSILYYVLNKQTGLSFENRSDFKLLDREVVDCINSLPERITFFRGIVSWLGYPTTEILFEVGNRISGKPSWSFLSLSRLAIDAITGFTTLPLRIVTACSVIFIVIAFLLIFQTLYIKFSGRAIEGFTTVIISTLIVGGVVSFSLGIIGEYLSRIYEEVKKRPHFVIQQTLNLKKDKSLANTLKNSEESKKF